MLVLLSDLHFSDASAAENVSPKSFNILEEEIVSQIEKFAKLSQEGVSYKPVKEIRIVLNGDIFDLVRSDYWSTINNLEKPWNWNKDEFDKYGMNTPDKCEIHYNNVLDLVLDSDISKAFFRFLNNLKNKYSTNEANIPINVVYVIGNHDRAFYVFDSLKNKINALIPEGIEITYTNCYKDPGYSVICRHGNEFDKNCSGKDFYNLINDTKINIWDIEAYKTQNIGEVLTAEFASGIVYYIRNNSKDELLKARIIDLDNVKPMGDLFNWLAGLGNNLDKDEQKILIDSCIYGLSNLLNSDLAKKWDDIEIDWLFKGDLTDYLSKALALLKAMGTFNSQSLLKVYDLIGPIFAGNDEYEKGAKQEIYYKDNIDLCYVIYGHTHEAKKVIYNEDISGKKKMYVNFGHWGKKIFKAKDGSFTSMDSLPMVFIYQKDEGKNTNYPNIDFWDGSRICL